MFDRNTAKEQANRITATGKAVAFPANLKVYTSGKAPGVDKWLVYARMFSLAGEAPAGWEYLESAEEVDTYLEEVG